MKNYLTVLCLLGLLSISSLVSTKENAARNIYQLNLTELNSEIGAHLSDAKNRWIYIDFWASWCAPCKRSFPFMNKIQSLYPELKIITINCDELKQDADNFLVETPAEFTVIFDHSGQLANRMQVQGMPTSYLINPDGQIINIHQGFTATTPEKLTKVFNLIYNQ